MNALTDGGPAHFRPRIPQARRIWNVLGDGVLNWLDASALQAGTFLDDGRIAAVRRELRRESAVAAPESASRLDAGDGRPGGGGNGLAQIEIDSGGAAGAMRQETQNTNNQLPAAASLDGAVLARRDGTTTLD